MINRKKKLHFKVAVERKFFLLVGHLAHFSLCFALDINEQLKLHGIIFYMFETKVEGVTMQTDNYCVDIHFSQSIPDFGVSTAIMPSSRHFPWVVLVRLLTLARKR